MKTWLNFRVGGFTLHYVSDNMWNISFSLLPSPLILGGDKSIAIYDSFVAAGRSLLPCLAVIPADSFRSVSLFKSCCNYTGFSICRRPDMIQTTATGRGELNGWTRREIKHNGGKRERERERERKVGDGEKEGRKETERERYGERGRLIEQLRDEERAAGRGERKRYGLANKRGARRCCKLFALWCLIRA